MLTHQPIMVNEVLNGLSIQPRGIYIDATFGRGGHSAAILQALDKDGILIAFDQDPEAAHYATHHFTYKKDKRFRFMHQNFSTLEDTLNNQGMMGACHGILLDVGVSSPQLDDPQRGFSFQQSGPLDMRMNPDEGTSARQWLIHNDEQTIANTLWQYGQERLSRRIARAIKQALQRDALQTTADLSKLVQSMTPTPAYKHPEKRTFQALRIVVNNELNILKETLDQAWRALVHKGRLAILSFHSLEHQTVKQFIKDYNTQNEHIPKNIPIQPNKQKRVQLIRKCTAKEIEITNNPRARSAQLHILEKLTPA